MVSLYGLLWDQQRALGGHYGFKISTHPPNRNLQALASGHYSLTIPGYNPLYHGRTGAGHKEVTKHGSRELRNRKYWRLHCAGGFTVLVASIGVQKPFDNSEAKRQEASRERDLGMVSKGDGGVPHTRPVTHQGGIWGVLYSLLFLFLPMALR